MRRGALLAALGLLVDLAGTAGAQPWRELGPSPIANTDFTGRAAALALGPSKKFYYVAGASGGVWHSKNGGKRWRDRGKSLPTLAIGALALDPNDPRTVYAGSGEAHYAYHSLYGLGLYKSTDRGKSWRVLAPGTFAGRTFSRIAVSAEDGDELWAAVARAGGSKRGIEGARRHPRRLDRMGLFHSTDGGASWTAVASGLPSLAASDVDLDPTDPERLYVSFGDVFGKKKNGVYRSTDGGTSFRKLALGARGGRIGEISFALAPSDPRRLYALVAERATRRTTGGFAPGGADTYGLLRSDDGGDSWTRLDPGNPQPSYGHYYSAIAVHPEDPDVVVVGGLELWISFDGGASYRDITPPHVDIHDLAFDAAGRLVVACDGGVYRSDDLGETWVPRNGKLATVQFYAGLATHPGEPDRLLGGTQDNGTNLYLGPGSGWVLVAGGDGGWSAIHPADPNELFVQFQGAGNLYRSNDGGFSFVQIALGIDPDDRTAFQAPLLLDTADGDRLLYATQRIYESRDRGGSWNAISGDLTGGAPWAVRSLVQAPSRPEVLYAVTSDDRVLVSENGGSTWSLSHQGLAGWPRITRQIAVDPEDDRVAYLADMRFGGDGVLATTDRGGSWRSIAGDLPDRPVNTVGVLRRGGQRVLLAGTDAGVFVSTDGGAHWQEYGSGLPNAPVVDLLVDTAHSRLVVATLGRGVWTNSLPG